MKKIILDKGAFAIVDDGDYDYLSQWGWLFNGRYAIRSRAGGAAHGAMHKIIMCPPVGKEVDHINHDRLDNRRENLRICTRLENSRNIPVRSDSRTGYKGVSFRPANNKSKPYFASITVNRKRISLGYFDNATLAAIAYDRAASEIFGEFAFLNLSMMSSPA